MKIVVRRITDRARRPPEIFMTERKKDWLFVAALLGVLVIFFGKILFTDKIIRAPDIINEFYWGVVALKDKTFWDAIKIDISHANWDILINSGNTDEGGSLSVQFLLLRNLLLWLVPAPANVAWLIVTHLFLGAAGTYCYCRLIGVSRAASFFAGLLFAVAPENASLINAGHVMKLATISYAPWAFYFLEKGFRSRRVFHFLATGFVLAYQFFNVHWQIAYYTCLAIALYSLLRMAGIILREKENGATGWPRLLTLNLVTLLFFLSTVAISLAPLANWSKGTNRGTHSGANQGKGGLERDEAMQWSLPPEELGAFVIPGFFGFSRQEAGENPDNIQSYYWGRMIFTQTVSYMGLLPWLLLPLPLLFRRDKYTWIALAAITGGILFSMGKYTPFYNLLYDYFPGVNRFRVPKMMMFIPVFGLAVAAARGMDVIRSAELRATANFQRYLTGLIFFTIGLFLLLPLEQIWRDYWIRSFVDLLARPTRYEQGIQLVIQRWNAIVSETAIASCLAAACCAAIWACWKRWISEKAALCILLIFFIGDVRRVDSKFLFLVNEPQRNQNTNSGEMKFLAGMSSQYRLLPLAGDPVEYAARKLPIMFTANAVQQRRWQDFLDSFAFNTVMPDIMNVKFVIFGAEQYRQQKNQLAAKYQPVFASEDAQRVVVENRAVMPKAWLVPAAITLTDPGQILAAIANPAFNPRQLAVVEAPPPLPLAASPRALPPQSGVQLNSYEGERINLSTSAPVNSLLVLGEKYYHGWKVQVDGRETPVVPVNYILRGAYLPSGNHRVEFMFDPLPFKIGKYLTLGSFTFFGVMLLREMLTRCRREAVSERG